MTLNPTLIRLRIGKFHFLQNHSDDRFVLPVQTLSVKKFGLDLFSGSYEPKSLKALHTEQVSDAHFWMRSLEHFPQSQTLAKRMQSLAVLDAILCPEWQFRYFSFNAHWDTGEMMGSIRNGLGDQLFALFSDCGCFIKEFYHESKPLKSPYTQVPLELKKATQEPAFYPENVTYCYWSVSASDKWTMVGPRGNFDPDASRLMAMVDGVPETYLKFASGYHERDLPLDLIAQIFRHQVLEPSHLVGFSFEETLETLRNDVLEIGYPSSL